MALSNESAAKDRAALIARARGLRADIADIFDTTEHWNRHHPHEEPIDPDPDGRLARMAEGLDRMLAAEGASNA